MHMRFHIGKILAMSFIGLSVFVFADGVFADIISGSFSLSSSTRVRETRVVLDKPGAKEGDLMLAIVAIRSGASAVVRTPAGWTLVRRTENDDDLALLSYYRFAQAGEPRTYTWTIAGQTSAEAAITVYSGIDQTHPIDTVGDASSTGATATAPSVQTAQDGTLVIAVFASDSVKKDKSGSYFSTAQGMTEKFDAANIPGGPALAYDEFTQMHAGQTGSYTVSIAGHKPRNWAAQSITLVPRLDGIRYDNSLEIPYGTPTSADFTVGNGASRALLVCEYTVNDNSLPPTYAGVPLTLVGRSFYHNVGNQGLAAYVMVNPPSGTHLLEERTAGSEMAAYVASYSGVDQAAPIDAFSTNGVDSQLTLTDSVNTSGVGDWLVMCTSDSGAGSNYSYSSTGTIRRQDFHLNGVIADSGTGVAVGLNSLSVSAFGTIYPTYTDDVLVALKPAL